MTPNTATVTKTYYGIGTGLGGRYNTRYKNNNKERAGQSIARKFKGERTKINGSLFQVYST